MVDFLVRAAEPMQDPSVVTDVAMVVGVAAITSVVARWLKQPTILGYLLAGLIVGPHVPLPVSADLHRVESMAEFGVVLVMFAVGLELRLAKLMKVLPTSGLVGLLQVSFLIWCGMTVGRALGWSAVESVFLGACVAISSTMVVSKVFEEKPIASDVREFVFGVLIFQDGMAIVLIAAMTAVAAGGGLGAWELASTLGRLAAVLVAMVAGGLLVVPRAIRYVAKLESVEILVVFSVGLCFCLAFAAKLLGYSVALGAFIAGILVAESGKAKKVEHLIKPLRDVFAAIFFVAIGMTVDPMQAIESLPTALLLFVVVVLAQLLVVTAGGILAGNGLRKSITAGLALGQIGEFAFILASIGISAGVVRSSLQSVAVTVAVLTAFTTPLFLAKADRVVQLAHRLLPERLHHLLGVYDEWLKRTRAAEEGSKERRPMGRAIRAIVFDAVTLTAGAAVSIGWFPKVRGWVTELTSLPESYVSLLLVFGVLALSAPLFVGLVRNTLALSAMVSRSMFGSDDVSGASRTLRIMVHIVVLLAVGLPAATVLRPLEGGIYGLLAVVVLLGVGLVMLWRNAGVVEVEFRSAAERIAVVLAEQGAAPEKSLAGAPLLPGLDLLQRLHVAEGSYAVGRTLYELDLRARTGASVVAIHREGGEVLVPTGHERLEVGDTLSVAATPEALGASAALLRTGPGPSATPRGSLVNAR
jgi:CPA2 family monovalent cation:H+ antiporter-2